MTKKLLFSVVCMLFLLNSYAKEQIVTSPDGKYKFTLSDEGGRLTYSLMWDGKEAIKSSQLGIKSEDIDWKNGLSILDVVTSENDSQWEPVYGERATVRDHYKMYSFEISKGGDNSRLSLDVKAFNEGIAFRYRFTAGQYVRVMEEHSEFTMPEGAKAYFTAKAQTIYEHLPLKGWEGESDRPLLVTLPNGPFVCLTEAEVVDYVRTKFKLSESKENTLATAMYEPVEHIAPYSTPWRVIMCGEEAGDILENNDIILNLNSENKIEDTSWIKPGKVMREVTLSTVGGKALVDFAVKRNLQYIHFDAGWYGYEYTKESDATTITLDPLRNPDPNALNLKEVVDYAKQFGIGVIVYVNQRALEQQLDEILPLYKSWGIAGIKFGFVHVGSQMWTTWTHEAVKKCAAYGFMVDIHDEYRPTGFSRTYPNLMTQEGIRGNEEFPDATHNVTLPFTRYVAGAGDYTICYYRQDFGRLSSSDDNYGVPRSKSIRTTPTHQLALAAVYYSPLQYMYWYDKPSDSQDEPELKFFDDVYTTWDDTKVIQGEVGEYISVVRRKGEEWFVGSITNNDARKLSVDLSFLPSGVDFVAEVYTDGDTSGKTRTKVKVASYKVDSTTTFNFSLMPSGGSAIRLVPVVKGEKAPSKYKNQIL